MAKAKQAAETHDVQPTEPQGPPAPPKEAKTLVGRIVHYYAKGDADPQAAIIQKWHAPVDGSYEAVDLFVFGVPSQGLTQTNAQKVPIFKDGPVERCKEWCELA